MIWLTASWTRVRCASKQVTVRLHPRQKIQRHTVFSGAWTGPQWKEKVFQCRWKPPVPSLNTRGRLPAFFFVKDASCYNIMLLSTINVGVVYVNVLPPTFLSQIIKQLFLRHVQKGKAWNSLAFIFHWLWMSANKSCQQPSSAKQVCVRAYALARASIRSYHSHDLYTEGVHTFFHSIKTLDFSH